MVYKQKKSISYSFEGWKPKIMAPAVDMVFAVDPLPGSQKAVFPLGPHMVEGAGSSVASLS